MVASNGKLLWSNWLSPKKAVFNSCNWESRDKLVSGRAWSRTQTMSVRTISELHIHWLDTFSGFQWTSGIAPGTPLMAQKLQASYPQAVEPGSRTYRCLDSQKQVLVSLWTDKLRSWTHSWMSHRGQRDLLGPSLNYIPVTIAKREEYANWPLDLKVRCVLPKPHGWEWKKERF